MQQIRYKKGTFLVIPNKQVLSGMKPSEQVVYFWICNFADENGICFPSRKKLAQCAGISISSIVRTIKKLEEKGLLAKKMRMKKDGKENDSNEYQILIAGAEGGGVIQTLGGVTLTPGVVSGWNTNSIHTKLNPINSIAEQGSAEVFNFEEELTKLKNSNRKDLKIIALYWKKKNWKFENRTQLSAALKRELRAAADLKGYSGEQIARSITFCQKEYPDKWTLETVFKRIQDLVNKNSP